MMASQQKVYKYDWIFWVLALGVLAILALSMLIRDSKKQYGALSFGDFPAFSASDSNDRPFDEHRLHGQLSAVIISEQSPKPEIIAYLQKLSQMTAMGKKYLSTIILVNADRGTSTPSMQYLTLDKESFTKLSNWKNKVFKDGVILVDQNGIVRGVFDLEEKLDRMNFEGAVKGIL